MILNLVVWQSLQGFAVSIQFKNRVSRRSEFLSEIYFDLIPKICTPKCYFLRGDLSGVVCGRSSFLMGRSYTSSLNGLCQCHLLEIYYVVTAPDHS